MKQLPPWSHDVKKWMGEAGAMTNLQREFILFIDDSLIQPLRKHAAASKAEKDLANQKVKELLDTITHLAELNASLKLKLKSCQENNSNQKQVLPESTAQI